MNAYRLNLLKNVISNRNVYNWENYKRLTVLGSVIPQKLYVTTTATVTNEENVGIFKKLFKRAGWTENSKSKLKMSSYILYETVADNVNYHEFFTEFNLPNSFNSWFLITELHVWMLMVRVMAEGSESNQDGRFMRNTIVEALWGDVNIRAKKLGPENPSGIRKHIQVMSHQFQAALITYDEGITSNDQILAGALWRRFFDKNCESFEKLELLVHYVRKQMKMLDSIPRHDLIIKPKINWLPLKEN